ncbi:unnamed protein product [Cercopithifilaria johnstoni]|uniref:Uncharacterized protein n=1 Tax=Cercopithifilaria johnstoni TaxID=2874296 RepID=A0A8J2Q893_9BILA|nr:unnamed protein product [Cercopithifilaria johnstoni]
MNKRSDPKKSNQTNMPFVQSVAPRAPRSPPLRPPVLRSPTPEPRPLTLEPRPPTLGPRPLTPPLSIARPNMDMFVDGIRNSPLYGHIPVLTDEQRFRCRRQAPTHTANHTWTQSKIDPRSLLVNVNNIQSEQKIVNITYTDPTGGSMIVTRRREDGYLDVRAVYSRNFIVAASASPLALLPPPNFRQMVLEMMEIIAKFPKSYYNTISGDSALTSSK